MEPRCLIVSYTVTNRKGLSVEFRHSLGERLWKITGIIFFICCLKRIEDFPVFSVLRCCDYFQSFLGNSVYCWGNTEPQPETRAMKPAKPIITEQLQRARLWISHLSLNPPIIPGTAKCDNQHVFQTSNDNRVWNIHTPASGPCLHRDQHPSSVTVG